MPPPPNYDYSAAPDATNLITVAIRSPEIQLRKIHHPPSGIGTLPDKYFASREVLQNVN